MGVRHIIKVGYLPRTYYAIFHFIYFIQNHDLQLVSNSLPQDSGSRKITEPTINPGLNRRAKSKQITELYAYKLLSIKTLSYSDIAHRNCIINNFFSFLKVLKMKLFDFLIFCVLQSLMAKKSAKVCDFPGRSLKCGSISFLS